MKGSKGEERRNRENRKSLFEGRRGETTSKILKSNCKPKIIYSEK
jgi:hypothetical protein